MTNERFFDYEPDSDGTFAILAGEPPRKVIAERVGSKPVAQMMAAAPRMLAALKRSRPFILHDQATLRDVDEAISFAEGSIGTPNEF